MIYQRSGSPKWQMRLKIPDRAGYVVKSTKQKDKALAEELARKEFNALAYKVENNLEIKSYDFAKKNVLLGGKGNDHQKVRRDGNTLKALPRDICCPILEKF
ncbi:MAG: hypothetical protein ACPGQV_11935 [Alphaproteobacteria bacterium]